LTLVLDILGFGAAVAVLAVAAHTRLSRGTAIPRPAIGLILVAVVWVLVGLGTYLRAAGVVDTLAASAGYLTILIPVLLLLVIYGCVYEEELVRRRLLLEYLADTIRVLPVAVVGLDKAGRVMFWNAAAASLLGLPEARDPLPRGTMEPGPRVVEALGLLESPLAESWRGEVTVEREEGQRRALLVACTPIEESSICGETALVCAADLSLQVHLQQQVWHLQRLDSLALLAAGVAHDFNNLLMAISGFASLLLARHPEPEQVHPLEAIQDATERGAGVTRQLLAFARERQPVIESVSLAAVVDGVLGLLRETLTPRVRILADVAEDLPEVLADPGQVHQVLVNLAPNSRDAMPEGGELRITARRLSSAEPGADGYVDLEPGEYVELCVSDTGEGIQPCHLPRIFDPFFTTRGVGRNTGLGLSVVHGIVRAHGGDIQVSSVPEQGTTFRIALPVSECAEPLVEREAARRPGRGIVLVVEDEEAITVLWSTDRALPSLRITLPGAATLVDLMGNSRSLAAGRCELDLSESPVFLRARGGVEAWAAALRDAESPGAPPVEG